MAFLPAHPVLDHLVIDVRDRMATGAARMAALGFQLTPMGKHSLGSANHLAVFGEDYLELLGTDVPGGALRPDIATYPVGLNGLVFRTEAAEALSARLVAHGVPALPAQSFHRPVDLPDGAREEARFRTVRLDRGAGFDGRIYWCEHLTPQHVWRPEWQVHPNGVTSIARVLVSARDPERQAAMFRRIFGEVAMGQGPEGRVLLPCGPVTVEVAPHAAVAAELGAAAPDPAGRGDHLVLVALRVRDLAATSALLRAKGVSVEAGSGGLRVAAEPALNATLDFLG